MTDELKLPEAMLKYQGLDSEPAGPPCGWCSAQKKSIHDGDKCPDGNFFCYPECLDYQEKQPASQAVEETLVEETPRHLAIEIRCESLMPAVEQRIQEVLNEMRDPAMAALVALTGDPTPEEFTRHLLTITAELYQARGYAAALSKAS